MATPVEKKQDPVFDIFSISARQINHVLGKNAEALNTKAEAAVKAPGFKVTQEKVTEFMNANETLFTTSNGVENNIRAVVNTLDGSIEFLDFSKKPIDQRIKSITEMLAATTNNPTAQAGLNSAKAAFESQVASLNAGLATANRLSLLASAILKKN